MRIGIITIHAHPIAVHFTNALYPVALLFLTLHLWTGRASFATAYFLVLVVATISVPVSYLTGIIDWWQEYEASPIGVFKRKLRVGAVLFVMGLLTVLWYTVNPNVLAQETKFQKVIFLGLNFAIMPLVVYLGYLGGRLVFHRPH